MQRGASRRALRLAIACVLAVAGCADETDAQHVRPTGDRGAGATERIARSALHATHAAVRPAIACDGCHEQVAGEYLRAKSWRCKQCHAETSLVLHDLAPVDSPARECFSCHDFASTTTGAVACQTCHDRPQGGSRAIGPHDRTDGNREEDCATCHRAHRQPALASPACESCHREPVSGHDKPGIPITGCASCHGYHEVAAEASGRCTNCHRQSRARVPLTATFANGHVTCVTCHRPHRFVKTEVMACRGECHRDRIAIAEARIAQHRCTGCHANHDVRASASRSCESTCHGRMRPTHPRDRASKTRCLGCHRPHPSPGAAAQVAVACTSAGCHRLASDRAFHQGARGQGPECRSCHRPHDFQLAGTGVASCKGCHGPQPFPGARSIRTHAKHDDCFGCHGQTVRHQPAGPRAACASCHRDEAARVNKGHARCVGCHDPHTTERATCSTCHAKEAAIARKDHRNCVSCHEPHAGTQKRPCAGCHATEAATAPREHQQCTRCHDQHSTLVTQPCGSCHVDRTTGVHARVDCASCHRPHGPSGRAAPPACTSCHAALPLMHQVAAHRDCKSCHRSHGEQPYKRREACLVCHKDRGNHVPDAVACFACHNFGGVR